MNNINCFPCVEHKLVPMVKVLAPDQIILEVCKYMNVPVGRIIGNKRSSAIVNTRHLIADILYSDKFLNMSLKEIGRILGGRDHSTIMNAHKKVSNLCETDLHYRDNYRKLHLFLYDSDRYFKYTEAFYQFKKKYRKKQLVSDFED